MEHGSTRHKDREPGTGSQKLFELLSSGHDLLEVIKHEQELLLTDKGLHLLQGWPVSTFLESQLPGNGGTTNCGSERAANPTKQVPPTKKERIWVATAMARRVLPIPPGPSRVSRRISGCLRRALISATSGSRPISEVGGIGRVLWYVSRVLRGGKSAGKPEMTSSKRWLGCRRSLRRWAA